MTPPQSLGPVRRGLAVALIASLTVSLAAPGLHARPGDPMGCAEHHALFAGATFSATPHAGCAATPDACRTMLGCGAVSPALATAALVVLPGAVPLTPRVAPTARLSGLPALGPATPPPNS